MLLRCARRILAGFALLIGAGVADGAEQVLWQIGKIDYSTLEFNQAWDFAAARELKFTVGSSDPSKDWSAFQPGSEDQSTGSRPHPFTVSFELKAPPEGVFHLTINLLFKSPGIPQYLVEINGKKGRFLLNPQLSQEIGDPETAWNILFSRQRLSLDLPASLFHAGANQVVLTCLGGNYQPILRAAAKVDGPAGVYYDELQLSNDAQATWMPQRRLTATPTMFYRSGPAGLRETVTLRASSTAAIHRGAATLSLAGKDYSCDLDSPYDFGDSECAVEVPEFSGATQARLTFRSGSAAEHADITVTPVRKWKLFLAPQMHLDMGYTDYRPDSYEVHARNIDGIVSALEAHKDYKFNPDGAFIYSDYWEHRTPARQDRVVALLKEGRLTLPAQLFTINTGLASSEELFRLFYASAEFGKSYQVPIQYADQTDVPAHVWALPSYLRAIGVSHMAISSNPFRGAIIPNGKMNARAPFWWEGPDGSRVLTSFSRQYTQFEQLFTTGNNIPAGIDSLPIFLQTYAAPDYAPDAVLLYGTQSDNRPFLAHELGFPEQWNKEFAFPRLQIVTFEEYFSYVEREFGSSLPVLKGDGGAWWEEMAASNAHFASITRRTKERALAAEKLASLASAINPDIPFPSKLDKDIWDNLLFYTEHTWGAAATWKHPESDQAITLRSNKEAFTENAARGVEDMMHRALSQIGDKLNLRGPSVAVYNTLSWPRSGEVDVELERGKGLADPKTGAPIPLEIVRRIPDEDYDRVRFQARDLPPLGYRCYSIVARGASAEAPRLPLSNTIESPYYRVVVDAGRGAIVSIYDKSLSRELVDTKSPYGLNQYVYAGYGRDGETLIHQRVAGNSSLLQLSPALPLPDLKVSTPTEGKLLSVEKTQWGARLTMTSSAIHTPSIVTEIRLFDGEKKIRICNRVRKDAVESPEGVYFAFPFAATPGRFRFETQNAWVDPEHDQLPGADKEWFSAQHWVSVTAPDVSIGLVLDEAPLLTLGDIVRGVWPTSFQPNNGTVFSYVMDNYDGDDERPFQGGDFTFHYSITSAPKFDPESLSRFSREEVNPLEADQVTEADKLVWNPQPLNAQSDSFIEIDQPQVQLMTWKGAEDGRGSILRFYNTGETPVSAVAKFPHLRFQEAYWTSGTENDSGAAETSEGALRLSLKPHEIRTVRLTGMNAYIP
jgi:hypothetical protein